MTEPYSGPNRSPGVLAAFAPVQYIAPCPNCGCDCVFTSTITPVTRTMHDQWGQNQTYCRDEVQVTEDCKCQREEVA